MADVNAMDLMLWSVPTGCAVVAGTAIAAIAGRGSSGAGATIAAASLPAHGLAWLTRPASQHRARLGRGLLAGGFGSGRCAWIW